MTNTNCLEGIRCPKCGQEDRFFIIGGAQFEVTDDGSKTMGDHEWDDDSPMSCPECGHAGKVGEFSISTPRTEKPILPPEASEEPDSDITNETRSERASSALQAYVEAKGEVFENSASEIADLIADLLHLAIRIDDADNGPTTVLRLARMRFDAEHNNPEEE